MSRAAARKPRAGDEPETMTVAQARRAWARLVRIAGSGRRVEVARHGRPVAAVVGIEDLPRIRDGGRASLADVIAELRSDPSVLRGPDPWRRLRGRSPGRPLPFRR
jgi:prevent-host-death family protein